MKKIILTQGQFALVDDEDYDKINQYKWHALKSKGVKGFYAYRNMLGKKESEYMHRAIMNAKKGELVDHINHNSLDNRKENLRLCTRQQNNSNRKIAVNNKSGYKGVSWSKDKKKWQTYFCLKGKSYFIGRFSNIKDAAIAYNNKAISVYGDFALLNKL